MATQLVAGIDSPSTSDSLQADYAGFVNPIWVKLRNVLGMNVQFCALRPVAGDASVSRHRCTAQIRGNNFMALKLAPPLVISDEQLSRCAQSVREVMEMMHSSTTFWSDAPKLGRRAMSA
jgi:hypothetical protein